MRRMRVSRLAWGAGFSSFLRRPARMNASMGVLIQAFAAASVKTGGGVSARGTKAQWRRSAGLYVPSGATASSAAHRVAMSGKDSEQSFHRLPSESDDCNILLS